MGLRLLLFFLILSPLACERFQNGQDDPVLARVGSEELTLSMALGHIPEAVLQRDTLSALKQYQIEWVEKKVMEREAVRAGMDRNPEVLERLNRLRSSLVVDALKEAILVEHQNDLVVSREEAQNYFQANRERFTLNEKFVRYRHLTTVTADEAADARQDLLDGVSWEDVAEQYSIQPEHQIQQAERYIPISMAFPDNPPMRQFLDVIGITEVSPVRSHNGYYHFIQLLEERPEGDNPDLEWLIEQIQEWLYLEKARRFINSYRRNLYLQADANNEIELHDVEDSRLGTEGLNQSVE